MTTEVMITNSGGKGVLASGLKYSSVSWDKSIDDFGEATVRIPAQCVPNALIGAHPFVHELRIEVNDEVAFVGPIEFAASPLKDSADLIIYARDMAYWLTARFARRARNYVDAPVEIIVREIIQQALRLDDPNLWRYITVHASDIIHSRKVESRYDNAWDDHLKSIVGKLMHMRAHGRSVDFWERGTYLGELPRVRADQFSNFNNLVYDGEEYATHSAVFGADAIEAVEADPDVPGDTGTPGVPAVFGIAQAARSSQFRKVRVERTLRDSSYLDPTSACTAAHSLIAPRAPLGFGSTDQFRAETNCDTPWPITRVAPGMYVQLGTPLGEIGMQVRNVSGTVDSNGIETFFIGFEEVTEYTPCDAPPKKEVAVVVPPPPPPPDCEIGLSVAADLRDGTWQESRLEGGNGAVVADGNYVYIFGQDSDFPEVGTLVVIDISNSTAPSIVGYLRDVNFEDVRVPATFKEGDYIYAGTGTNNGWFHIIDVSNPAAPAIVSSTNNPDTYSHLSQMVKVGDYVFGVDWGSSGAYAINVSNPAAPVYTDVWTDYVNDYFLNNEFGIVVEDGLMYVTTYVGFVILNVSDPSNIVLSGYLNLTGIATDNYGDVRKQGDYVFFGGYTQGSFVSIDVSNPAAPTLASSVTDPSLIDIYGEVFLEEGVAYVGTYGVKMVSINISDPTNISILNVLDVNFDVPERYGNYFVMSSDYNNDGVTVVDTTDPSNLVIADSLATPTDNPYGRRIGGSVLQGNHYYMVGGSNLNDAFTVISLCAEPVVENFGLQFNNESYSPGEVPTYGFHRPGLVLDDESNTFVVWGIKYDTFENNPGTEYGVLTARTVNGVTTRAGFLPVLDAGQTDPGYHAPALVGPNHVAMAIADASTDRYLRIFDISDPANVVQSAKLTSLPMASATHGRLNLAAYGSRLFMFPSGTANWYEIDCSDPTNPVLVRSEGNSTSFRSDNPIVVRGQTAYVQTQFSTLGVVKLNLLGPAAGLGFSTVPVGDAAYLTASDFGASFAYIPNGTNNIRIISGKNSQQLYLQPEALGTGRLRNVRGGRGFVQIGATMTRRWIFTDDSWGTLDEIIDTPIVGRTMDYDSLISEINRNGVGYSQVYDPDPYAAGAASWTIDGL